MKTLQKTIIAVAFTILPGSILLAQESVEMQSSLELKSVRSYEDVSAEEYYLSAVRNLDQGNYNVALNKINAAIAKEDDVADFYHKRALAYMEFGFYDEAVFDLRKAIHLDHNEAVYYFHRGVVNHKLNWTVASLHDFSKAIELNYDDIAEAYYQRALVYLDAKLYRKSIDDCDSAIDHHPSKASAYNLRGMAKQLTKDFRGAYSDYNVCIQLDQKNYDAFLNLGMCLYEVGEYEDCIKVLTKLIDKEPSYLAYKYRGSAYLNIDENVLARNDYRNTTQYKEDQPMTLVRVNHYYE